ncbi:hypothetical protein [Paenibacillus sp. NPDC057934]|uniref:hypothetical protein n=1 Tax=Paenibacillus sp. NPDC057934 TaxID=3346282 RepID=UPI0036D8848C
MQLQSYLAAQMRFCSTLSCCADALVCRSILLRRYGLCMASSCYADALVRTASCLRRRAFIPLYLAAQMHFLPAARRHLLQISADGLQQILHTTTPRGSVIVSQPCKAQG